DEAARIWRLGADLHRYHDAGPGGRFSRAPLLIALADATTARVQAQAAMLVRSFGGDGDDPGAWLSVPGCARPKPPRPPRALTAADQVVLAVEVADLRGDGPRRRVEEHAHALAEALAPAVGATAQQPGAGPPRVFVLLVDRERRFLGSLGPGAATPGTCAENG